MFKRFKKNEKMASLAFYAFLVGVALISFVFLIFKFNSILGALNAFAKAMSAFIYGFAIAYICNPLYKLLHKRVFFFVDKGKERRKLRKALSLFSTYIIFFSVIALILVAIILPMGNNIESFAKNIEGYINSIYTWLQSFLATLQEEFPSLDIDVNEIMNSITKFLTSAGASVTQGEISIENGSQLSNIVNMLLNLISKVAGIVINQVFYVIVGVILSIYFLIHKENISARIKKFLCAILKKDKYEGFMNFARYSDKTVGRYLVGTVCDSLLVGIVIASILAIFKFPMPALIGVIVGFTNMIPFFGPFIGGIPSAILIVVSPDGGIGKAIAFAVIIVILQQIDGNIIAPHIIGASTGLTPIGVIAAVTVCSYLFGIVGMIIGVPLCAVITYLFSHGVNGRLKKKNLPRDTELYKSADIFADEKFMQATLVTEAYNKIKEEEKLESKKIDSELHKMAIDEIKDLIINEKEQINIDVDEVKENPCSNTSTIDISEILSKENEKK